MGDLAPSLVLKPVRFATCDAAASMASGTQLSFTRLQGSYKVREDSPFKAPLLDPAGSRIALERGLPGSANVILACLRRRERRAIYEWDFPMSFKNIHEFKAKFKPTRWETLYLISSHRIGLRTLFSSFPVLFGKSASQMFWDLTQERLKKNLAVEVLRAPQNAKEWISRSKLTLSLVGFFTVLHFARLNSAEIGALFKQSAYIPSSVSALGVFVAPLFHNNYYHLIGDLLSFLAFGALFEIFQGRKLAITVIAAGLWLSNPLAHLFVATVLPDLSPVYWNQFLGERDYGSSNAVYALVGACAALLKNARFFTVPFILNAVFLCFSKESWLSLHHLSGMGLGYMVAWAAHHIPRK